VVSTLGFHPRDWSSILHGAIVLSNPTDLAVVAIVSESC